MGNVITTIFEKLKITKPSRNEKAAYFLMHDADTKEVCAVPEATILSKVNNRIDGILYPDGFTKTGTIQRVGNEVTIAALDFAWRYQLNPYTNIAQFQTTIAATTTPDLNRIDTLAASTENTIVIFQGEEVDETSVAIPPVLPSGFIRLTDIYVLGSVITETTEPFVSEVYTLAEKEKLAILDGTADIDKPVSTAQAAADAAVLADANTYADGLITQIIDGAPSDANTLKELNDKILAVQAIIGGTAPDGDALVNTVTELLAVFATYSEGVDLVTLLADKVNSGDVYNALDCIVAGKTLDARQGKVLNDALTALTSTVSGKQDTLVSGTNIKTINGSSILGSGDMTVGSSESATSLGALIGSAADATPNDSDYVATALTAGGILKKITWTNVKAFLKTYFDTIYAVPQITITTSVSITTDTLDASSYSQKGRNVVIDNSTNAINITVNGGTGFCASYVKHGTGAITFVQGSGRTLTQVDATAILNGAVGSTAVISSIGTKDYLRISNV